MLLPHKNGFRLWWVGVLGVFTLALVIPVVKCEEHEETDVVVEARKVQFDPTLVEVNQGHVRGVREEAFNGKEFYSFRGIPFAKPPLGHLRFQPPQDPDMWEEVLVGDKDPPICAQLDLVSLISHGTPEFVGAEDCLYLNVFSPMPQVDDTALLPVMVFIHGGAFQHGAASEYQPYALMAKDIVLVVIQYRLNTLGFLSTEDDEAPGNMGILDQVAALSWVQKNVVGFRGNPLQITIFGESAGAASVHFQLLSHASLGFFHRAILQSGNALTSWSHTTNHRQVAYHMAKLLKCGTSSEVETPEKCEMDEENPFQYESCVVDQLPTSAVLECLRQAPVQPLVELTVMFYQLGTFPLLMSPRVDKNILMKDPFQLVKEGRSKKVDIMIGVTKDEGSIWSKQIFANEGMRSALRFKFEEKAPLLLDFGVGDVAPINQSVSIFDFYVGNADFDIESLDNLTAMLGDRFIWYPIDSLTHYLARDEVAQRKGKKLYVYQFDYLSKTRKPSFFDYGFGKHYTAHAEELVYLFDTPYGHPWFPSPLETEADIAVRDAMVEMWTNFARTGNPTPDHHPTEWPVYTKDAPNLLHIDSNFRIGDANSKKEIRDFWRQLPLKMNLVLFPEAVTNLEFSETTDKTSIDENKQENSPAGSQDDTSETSDAKTDQNADPEENDVKDGHVEETREEVSSTKNDAQEENPKDEL
ncbi:Carboxylesterase type B [Trinorchestia longiramus]|nr:Carboxylesterase type B [Trinorchestia longiramus]